MMHKGADVIKQETTGMNQHDKLLYWQKQDELFEQKFQMLLREKQAKYKS